MARDPSILIVEDDLTEANGNDPSPPGQVAQDHVLVIDDEPDMLGLYKACLTVHGYRVTAATDGLAGLDLARMDPPSVVILDMVMPGMNGLEICDQLRGDAATSEVPILMVSGQDSVEDRISSLKKGADDFIAKPFEYEELVARVQALIRRSAVQPRSQPVKLGPDERRRLNILRQALREGPGALVPAYDPRMPCGFAYPAVRATPEEALEHDPLADLEYLQSRAYLERVFHDVVLVCPFCSHHDVHLREVCPACGSANLDPVEMIHHFRCAHTGAFEEFRKDHGLECPKCGASLRHVGLDYEKPPDTVACHNCGRGFQEPDVAARCRNCSRPFPPEEAERRRIYRYDLTASGRFAAEVGAFMEPGEDSGVTEQEIEVYRAEFFRELVRHEVTRSGGLDQPTALLRIGVRGLEKLVAVHGQAVGRRALRDVVDTIRAAMRDVDKIGRLRATDFVVMLPGADTRTAVALAREVADSFGQAEEGDLERLSLSYAWAVHPDEAEDADTLLRRVLDETPTAYLGDPETYAPDEEAGLLIPALGAASFVPSFGNGARPALTAGPDAEPGSAARAEDETDEWWGEQAEEEPESGDEDDRPGEDVPEETDRAACERADCHESESDREEDETVALELDEEWWDGSGEAEPAAWSEAAPEGAGNRVPATAPDDAAPEIDDDGADSVAPDADPDDEASEGRVIDFETWKRSARKKPKEDAEPWWAKLGDEETEDNQFDSLEPY